MKTKLAENLREYINAKHTQEECTGFTDGFEKACELFQSGLNEATVCVEQIKKAAQQVKQICDESEAENTKLKIEKANIISTLNSMCLKYEDGSDLENQISILVKSILPHNALALLHLNDDDFTKIYKDITEIIGDAEDIELCYQRAKHLNIN